LILAFHWVSSWKYASSGSSMPSEIGAFARRVRRARRSRNSSDVTFGSPTSARRTHPVPLLRPASHREFAGRVPAYRA
jgi:hypothetical protein